MTTVDDQSVTELKKLSIYLSTLFLVAQITWYIVHIDIIYKLL